LADQIFHLLSDLRSRRSQNVQERCHGGIVGRLAPYNAQRNPSDLGMIERITTGRFRLATQRGTIETQSPLSTRVRTVAIKSGSFTMLSCLWAKEQPSCSSRSNVRSRSLKRSNFSTSAYLKRRLERSLAGCCNLAMSDVRSKTRSRYTSVRAINFRFVNF
jgi:hypothetical protein